MVRSRVRLLPFPAGYTDSSQHGSGSGLRSAASRAGSFVWTLVTFPGGYSLYARPLPHFLLCLLGHPGFSVGRAYCKIITENRELWEGPSRFEQEPLQNRSGYMTGLVDLERDHCGVGQTGPGKGWAGERKDGKA